ncbi:MAG: sulfatase [Planctomycetota bacterium]
MPTRPHVVVLMTDQHRADCLSCAGHPNVRTPNLDRIAAEGTRFANTYTSCPVCMPARSSFLTGLYSHNHGQWKNGGHLPRGTDTFALRLREAGYDTFHVGKSHYYGHRKNDHLDNHKDYLDALGWSDACETTGPFATLQCRSALTDRWEKQGLWKVFREDYRRRSEVNRAKATWPSPLPEAEHPDAFVGRRAVEHIERYDADRPMLLFVGFGGPHYPWDPPACWAEKYDPSDMDPALATDEPPGWLPPAAARHMQELRDSPLEDSPVDPDDNARFRALYYAKISHIDHWCGRILEALEARGMRDDTAVVFWSDHGEMLGDKGRFAKSVLYDGAVRVPLIVRPPGGAAGGACEALVSLVDAPATILDLAGCGESSGGEPLGFGRSLVKALGGQTAGEGWSGREAVFSEIARRTMVCDGRYKMVVAHTGELLKLFDLREDPTEATNLAGRQETRDVVAALRERLLDWRLATDARQPAYPPASWPP